MAYLCHFVKAPVYQSLGVEEAIQTPNHLGTIRYLDSLSRQSDDESSTNQPQLSPLHMIYVLTVV
jgi:hypothetical protein